MSETTAAEVTPAYVPPPAKRTLGVWALVLGLLPAALLVIVVLLILVLQGVDPWLALGIFLLGIMALSVIGFVAGILAIVLGSLAVKRNRGRGLGIAGIVLGALSVIPSLFGLPGAIGYLLSSMGIG